MTLYQEYLESIAACQQFGTFDYASEDLKAVVIYLALKEVGLWVET